MTNFKVEFHCHSHFSPDCLSTPEALIATARKKGLDKLIITDHNSIRGAQIAQELAPDLIIVGEEIGCLEGEILAAFVKEEIPRGLPAEEVISRLREQDAFISVSHPMNITRYGHWKLSDLERISPLVDAIEGFNSRNIPGFYNQEAIDFAHLNNIPITVGSDAHSLWEVGRSTLSVPAFETAAELKENISSATADMRLSPLWVKLFSRKAWLVRKLGFSQIPR